jgi:5-hydroxyisourate hydrolase
MLSGQHIETGVYELTFHAGDYLRATGAVLSDPAFLDLVVVRFGVAELEGNYHVPLLLSPFGYSTYRGS